MNGMFQSEFQARIEGKVHAKYLRYLARHRHRTWCFSDSWRNFARSWRRLRNSPLANWLLLLLAALGGTMLTAGVVYFVVWFALNVFTATILDRPPGMDSWENIRDGEIAFARLALFHTFFWLGVAAVGLAYEPADSLQLHHGFVRRSQIVKSRAAGLFLFTSVVTGMALLGGLVASTSTLEHGLIGGAAVGLTCLVLGWMNYWTGRWLGRIGIPNRNGIVVGPLILAVAAAIIVLLIVLSGRWIGPLAERLPRLGPLGALYHWALRIGSGDSTA